MGLVRLAALQGSGGGQSAAFASRKHYSEISKRAPQASMTSSRQADLAGLQANAFGCPRRYRLDMTHTRIGAVR